MKVSIIMDLLEACNSESELQVAHKLLGAELELIVRKKPCAMRPSDFIQCSFAFRYLCHSVLESNLVH